MASAAELSKRYVGRTGLAPLGGTARVKISVVDVREGYGRVDLLVRPECGDGETWVRLSNVDLDS